MIDLGLNLFFSKKRSTTLVLLKNVTLCVQPAGIRYSSPFLQDRNLPSILSSKLPSTTTPPLRITVTVLRHFQVRFKLTENHLSHIILQYPSPSPINFSLSFRQASYHLWVTENLLILKFIRTKYLKKAQNDLFKLLLILFLYPT